MTIKAIAAGELQPGQVVIRATDTPWTRRVKLAFVLWFTPGNSLRACFVGTWILLTTKLTVKGI